MTMMPWTCLFFGSILLKTWVTDTNFPFNAKLGQGTELRTAFSTKHLTTCTTMMLSGHHSKCNSTTIAHVSFGPFWSCISLKHGLCFSNGRKLPTFCLHQIQRFLIKHFERLQSHVTNMHGYICKLTVTIRYRGEFLNAIPHVCNISKIFFLMFSSVVCFRRSLISSINARVATSSWMRLPQFLTHDSSTYLEKQYNHI